MVDKSRAVMQDSPSDVRIDQTGFYKWLVENGTPSFKSVMADMEPYLNTFGFVKGKDVITPKCLDNLKWIHKYYQSKPGAHHG
jgi:hypothetical protein